MHKKPVIFTKPFLPMFPSNLTAQKQSFQSNGLPVIKQFA